MAKKYNVPLLTDADAEIAMDVADNVQDSAYAAKRGSHARMILMILMPITRARVASMLNY